MTNPPFETKELVMYIDGASRGNPGPASVGVVIKTPAGEEVRTVAEYIGHATNNVAEYFSFIYALQEAAVLQAARVTVYTDSQLLARQFTGEYRVKEPHVKLLSRLVTHLKAYFQQCKVIHIPREKNKEADRLASDAVEAHL